MKKNRLIPFLLYKNGYIVQSRNFKHHKKISKAQTVLSRLSSWDADEVCLINIDNQVNTSDFIDAVKYLSNQTKMPLCIGGNIRSIDEGLNIIANGADKLYINRSCLDNPSVVKHLSATLGEQAIVAGIQYLEKDGVRVIRKNNTDMPNISLPDHIRYLESIGAGEISLLSETRDGLQTGFDHEGIDVALRTTNLPIVPFGGGRSLQHFIDGYSIEGLEALAAGNIFHFSEQSYVRMNHELREHGILLRNLSLP